MDPYMRGRMNTQAKSYTQPFEIGKPFNGGVVAQVIYSKREGFMPGDFISAFLSWELYVVIPAS